MTGRLLWSITRGPKLGEDIVAWCEEQCTEAVAEHVGAGHLVLTDRAESLRDQSRGPWTVRFILDDASASDPTREAPLAELIDMEIECYLTHEERRRFDEQAAPWMEELRDLLRAKADEIDAFLANGLHQPPPEPRWKKA